MDTSGVCSLVQARAGETMRLWCSVKDAYPRDVEMTY